MNIKDYKYNENDIGMNYKLFYPDCYVELPLIVYLHGAGERGKNASHLYRHGIYGHNEGIDFAYRNTKLIEWLTSQRRTNFEYVAEVCEDMF